MHSVARTLTTAAALLAARALLGAPSNGRAASTPAAKCAVAKIRAAFKKVSAKGACYEKAIATTRPSIPPAS